MLFYGVMWLLLVSGRFVKLWQDWKKKNPEEFKKEGSKKNPFAVKGKKQDEFEYQKPKETILTKKDITYDVELENGIKIKATENHLFLTKDGYKKVKDLTENDEVVLAGKKCVQCGEEFFYKQVQSRDENLIEYKSVKLKDLKLDFFKIKSC